MRKHLFFLISAFFLIGGCSRSNVVMDWLGSGRKVTSSVASARNGVLGATVKEKTADGYVVSTQVLFSAPLKETTAQGYKVKVQQGF